MPPAPAPNATPALSGPPNAVSIAIATAPSATDAPIQATLRRDSPNSAAPVNTAAAPTKNNSQYSYVSIARSRLYVYRSNRRIMRRGERIRAK